MGRILQKHFANRGDEVVVLTRHPRAQNYRVRMIEWDAVNAGAWCGELEGADVLINLVGRSVDCRYTAANRKAILESRDLRRIVSAKPRRNASSLLDCGSTSAALPSTGMQRIGL